MILIKHNPLVATSLSLAVMMALGTSHSIHAAELGAGDSHTVNAGDASEDWTLKDGASLSLTAGAEATNIVSTSSSLSIDGGKISSGIRVLDSTLNLKNTVVENAASNRAGVEILNNTNATIDGTSIVSTGNRGVSISGDGGAPGSNAPSTVQVLNSNITGMLVGVGVADGGILTLSGSTVQGLGSPSTAFLQASGLALFDANVTVNNGSYIKGDVYGVTFLSDNRGSSSDGSTVLLVDNSALEGTSSSAIFVTSPLRLHPTHADITLQNGAVLKAGNNILLEVADAQSSADFKVDNSALQGNIVSTAGGQTDVTLRNNASLEGSTAGVTSLTTEKSASWQVTADSDVATLNNGGSVAFTTGSAGRTLTVGNYTGNDGLLTFNSVLGGDNSQTDRLVVTGDTAGTTRVAVNNLGGSGAQTLNGIELISVGGNSAGEFTQQGRIVAGAYDYSLVKGGNNWYLSSQHNGTVDPGTEELTLRPEGGAYAANLAASADLFTNRLSDRQGTVYTSADGQQHYTSLWLLQSGGHTRAHDQSGQLSSTSNRYVAMLGGDIASGNAWRVGVLGGYGNSHSNNVSNVTHYRAKGDVDGYTTGLYGTWYAEGSSEKGLWLDSVVQYSWFNNTVSGEDVSSEKYRSSGLSASVEAGYVIPLSEGVRSSVYLQPQAQLAWSGISADDHTEHNGTRVTGDADNNLRSRLGVKAFMKGHATVDDNTGRSFKPFVEANWIHNTQNYGVSMDGVNITQAGTRNIAEVRAGVEGNLSKAFSLTGTVGQQVGDNGWSDTAATLGARYTF